jgi:hypothetical protein
MFLFNSLSIVKGASYTYTQLNGSSFKWFYNDYDSNNGYFYVYSGGGSFGISNITFSIFKIGGVDYRNAIVYDNNTSATIGGSNLVGFKLHYNRNTINSGGFLAGKVVEVKASFSGSYGSDNYSGSFYFKGSYNSDYTISNASFSDAPSFSLTFNNDYNYTSNNASFTMQYSNFTFQYFTFLNTDIASNGVFGGFHLLNYSVANNIVYCQFDNKFTSVANPHYLVFKVHGLDNNGNAVDLSGNTQFNLQTANNQYNGMKFRFTYEPYISPCDRPDIGAGVFSFFVDSGDGFKEIDANNFSLIVASGQVNGNPDNFSVSIVKDNPYLSRYKITWNNPNDPVDNPYHFKIQYLGLSFEGDFNPCMQNTIDFDQNGNIINTQTFDWKQAIRQILDIFKDIWQLITAIVNFFAMLLLAILNLVYSLGVAIISLLKIMFDFFASIFSILFNRDNAYHSLTNIITLDNTITLGKFAIAPKITLIIDSVLQYIHDNIVNQFTWLWSLIGIFILLDRHIIKKAGDCDDNE